MPSVCHRFLRTESKLYVTGLSLYVADFYCKGYEPSNRINFLGLWAVCRIRQQLVRRRGSAKVHPGARPSGVFWEDWIQVDESDVFRLNMVEMHQLRWWIWELSILIPLVWWILDVRTRGIISLWLLPRSFFAIQRMFWKMRWIHRFRSKERTRSHVQRYLSALFGALYPLFVVVYTVMNHGTVQYNAKNT